MQIFHPKVTAGALAGAIAVLIASECSRHGFPVAPEEASALTVILSGLAGYFVPSDDQSAAAPPQP